VRFESSLDGKTFSPICDRAYPPPLPTEETHIIDCAQAVSPLQARYVRVYAENLGVCPPWHPGHGGKAWLFVDEIIVE